MPNTKSWSGEPDPSFDQDFAEGFVGKYILVGITHVTHEDEFIAQEQLHGRIISASPEGIDIELSGVNEGKQWRMPPMFEELEPATPGIYQLRSTGESVDNPDFTFSVTVRKARKN